MEPELWDGSSHSISLHSSIEYLVSDSKNIRDSLNCVAKYISDKQINLKKSNDVEDLKGIGETIWNLIFSVYQLSWDSLYTDNNSATLRQKVVLKFTSKVKPIINGNNGNKNKLVPASIKKLSPPIPMKSPKEINQISKFFKNLKPVPINKTVVKSYTQASKPANYIEEVIRIKNAFPSLSASKIDQI